MKRTASSRPKSTTGRKDTPITQKAPPSALEAALPLQMSEISQDAIFCWRKPGGIEFWNRGASELYGYTQQEAIGRVCHQLLQTNFPTPWSEIEEELRTRGVWCGELQHRTRDGREIMVLSRFQIVPDAGEGMLVLESTRDITEEKANQEKLVRRLREQAVSAGFSLDALRATNIQTICDDAAYILARELKTDFSCIFECTTDGKALLLRAGAGWRAGHVGSAHIEAGEGTPIGRALHLNQPIVIADAPKDARLRLPSFMKEHGVVSNMAVVIQGRDHPFGGMSVHTMQPRTFDADDVHFLEAIGNVLATAISRIQFEHELRDTAARLKGIVDTAVDGIVTIDELGTVETMNPSAERIFGYKADEVIGRNVSMLMPQPYRSEHDGYLERYRRTGERRIIGIGREVRGRRKDGTEFPMDLAVSATNLGDRRIFTGLVRDISARKKLEQEILEVSDQEKRRLGSDLHDDLCQRLAGVRFRCDALKKRLPNIQQAEVRERLEKIGTDVSESIDRTRMLARGLAPVALETNGLASALEELTSSTVTLSKVKCSFRAKGKIAVQDPIAATHLFRITQEAINNALKHALAKQISVSLEKKGDKNVLTIADDGIGFSPTATQRGARGMGLQTIAYRAGMIGADVEVQSQTGAGSKIIVTFRSGL